MKNRRISDLAQKSPLKEIPVKDIYLDEENPRIQFARDSKKVKGDKNIKESDVTFFLSVKSKPYIASSNKCGAGWVKPYHFG